MYVVAKKERSFSILVCCLVFIWANAASQTTWKISIMGIPQVYIRPELIPAEDNIMGILPGSRWIVCSDRISNAVFTDFTGNTLKSKVSFLEAFYVTNVKGEFLHLYTDPHPDADGILSPKAVDRGWISKSKVLLWRSCLLVNQNSSKKQMQVMTLGQTDLFDPGQGAGNARQGIAIYKDPNFKEKTTVRTQPEQLYFVYKTEGNALLIGTEKRIALDAEPAEIVLGWIPRDFSYILDSRTWISPNNALAAISERQSKNIDPICFLDETHAKSYKLSQEYDKKFVIWQFSAAGKVTDWPYFPLIEQKGGILKAKIIDDEFKTGYGPMKADWMENDLFCLTTLINNADLNAVTINMHTLLDNSVDPVDRDAFKKTILILFKKEQDALTDNLINNLPVREVLESLFWIVNLDDPALNQPFRDLSDPALVPDQFFKTFTNSVKTSEKSLSKIINTNNFGDKATSFISNNTRYFRIDLSLFPH